MNKKNIALATLITLFSPVLTYAVDFAQPKGGFTNLTSVVTYLLDPVWVIFTGFAVVAFVVSGILFLSAQGDPNKLTTARQSLIWGVVGVVVAILGFSIMTIVKTTLAE